MFAFCRRCPLAGILLLGLLSTTGCNLMALPFFLMPGMEPRNPPKFKLTSDDKEKVVKVVILATSNALNTAPEFVNVDRELCQLLSRKLQETYKANKDKVTLVSSHQVQRYKETHPNWKELSAAEIGKYFKADYVIDLEINSMSLYEQGSFNTMYYGRASISIDLVDMSDSSEGIKKDEFTIEFPKTKGPMPADGRNPAQFRQLFLEAVAKQLSWRFTSHLIEDENNMTD